MGFPRCDAKLWRLHTPNFSNKVVVQAPSIGSSLQINGRQLTALGCFPRVLALPSLNRHEASFVPFRQDLMCNACLQVLQIS